MKNKTKDKIIFFLAGLLLGMAVAALSWGPLRKTAKELKDFNFTQSAMNAWHNLKGWSPLRKQVIEDFSKPLKAVSATSFGEDGQLTFELFRNGDILIDGKSGYAWQTSGSYRDSAFIRSTEALPDTYKISVVVGDIDYGLEKIAGLKNDPEYTEGPLNENGCYLLAITDTAPLGHHTNIWWHQHRKVVIDVDNNVWGHGMPNPMFMVYFDKDNKLQSFDGRDNAWQSKWEKAVSYEPDRWYRIEIEKTRKQYVMSISTEQGKLLKKTAVDIKNIWHADGHHPDYLVVGDPHENYYQGSMKIKEISVRY